MTMDTSQIIIFIGVLLIAAIVVVWAVTRKRRTQMLRSRFGPEYERAVQDFGGQQRAERELSDRQERTEKYHIRHLTREETDALAQRWTIAKSRFVDNPPLAIHEADHLVQDVMYMRGYPATDFDRRAADLSVDHPDMAANYRAAHEIAMREHEGGASTDELRRAMVSYSELLDELLERQTTTPR